MKEETQAAEHLRVIRTLMERATVYRAISAPTALVGGLLSLAVAGLSLMGPRLLPFFPSWLFALAVTLLVNALLVWHAAGREGRPLFSSGMRLALRSISPSILTAAVFSVPFIGIRGPWPVMAMLWVVFYGLALLSMEHFSPRSLVWLGRIFLFAGLLCFSGIFTGILSSSSAYTGHLIMGVTFGVFHLIYAACTWPRKLAAPAE